MTASAAWQDVKPMPVALDNDTAYYRVADVEHARAADAQQIAALRAENGQLRDALKRENKEICEAVTETVRWQVRCQEAQLEVARLKAAMGELAELGRAADSDRAVITAIRNVVWEASVAREFGEDRTLTAMVQKIIAQRDEARDNRRGEFDLRMKAEADQERMREAQAQWQQKDLEVARLKEALIQVESIAVGAIADIAHAALAGGQP